MAFDLSFGDPFGAIAGIIDSAADYTLARETNAKNEALMRESWAREDNAVQRRVADLSAAGMNPVLAAGAPAQSSPAIRLENPYPQNAINRILTAITAKSQIARTAADAVAAEAMANKQKKEWETIDLNKDLYNQNYRDLLTMNSQELSNKQWFGLGLQYDNDRKLWEVMKEKQDYENQKRVNDVAFQMLRTQRDIQAHDWEILKKYDQKSNQGGFVGQLMGWGQLVDQIINGNKAKRGGFPENIY